MEKDVVEKLSELGFELDSYSNGKHECVCPMCSHKRKPIHQKQKCAAVWIEDDFATYNCVHCGEHGFITTDKPSVHKQKYTKPLVVVKNNADEAEEFFKSRGISVETLKKFGVYVEREKFSEPMIAFPYFKGGRVVNVKYRGIKQKKFCQEVNCEPVVYNYDNVFSSKTVLICEGEIDALTFAEAGFDNIVSIPSGSVGNEVSNDYDGAKFDFLKVSQPLFDVAEKIYLALDSDLPGQYMTKALIDRIGREKIMLVDWTKYRVQGKDANDFWLKDKTIIADAIATAKEIPLRGIIQAGSNIEMFEQYLVNGTKNAISCGFDNLDRLIKFEPGNFVTITGVPGCLHGDTIIRINREGHSKGIMLKKLYKRFNGLDTHYKWTDSPTYVRRVVNGRVGLYPIENVVYSGYKQLFKLELEDGKFVKATAEHKILTKNGYVQLKDLKKGDLVAVDNETIKLDYSAVKSITELGYDDVYDIQCTKIPDNEPNFYANGIIVHNSGKSYFATAMILNLAKNYNMKTLYCAFENSQNQLLKKWCQILAGRPVVDASEEVLKSIRPHYQFIRDHFYIMEDMTSNLTVDSLLDVASQAVKQHGIKCIIIDPLNKLNYSKSNNMTEDIGQLLNKLISFAKRHNVLMFLVAHPTKPADGSRKLGSQNVPSGYDIAGSANFLNMSDVIMTVHRKQDENGNKSSVARVMISKVRDTDYGHEGSCYFDYNPYSGRYFEVDKAYYDNAKNNESEVF